MDTMVGILMDLGMEVRGIWMEECYYSFFLEKELCVSNTWHRRKQRGR